MTKLINMLYYMYNSKGVIMLEQVLSKVLDLPHISNAKGAHESAVESILEQAGLDLATIEQLGISKKAIRTASVSQTVKPNIFVPQPCGSQSFPDFIVSDSSGKIFYIECKSSKDDKIVWNSGFPKKEAIYIVSSGKQNIQSVVLGEDIWDEEEERLAFEAFSEMKKIQEQYYAKLKSIGSKLRPYCREMYNDSNKIAGHEDREQRIQRVYDSIRGDVNGQSIKDIRRVL